jgi:serine/threonine protein phosphatase PrpC
VKIDCIAFTHNGLARPNNEDSILCDGWVRNRPMIEPLRMSFDGSSTAPRVFSLADGLGGHASGETASQFVLARICAAFTESTELSEDFLVKTLQDTHKALFELSSASPAYRGMGATVAGLALDETGTVRLFHVGDSRIYRREDRFLQLLTKDDRPEPSGYGESDSESDAKATLLQCLGGLTSFSEIVPHVGRFEMRDKQEVFLLCSDGLSDMLTLDEIEESMTEIHEESVRRLFESALAAGAKDNVSILIVEITPDPVAVTPGVRSMPQTEPGVKT